ncbi:radical SAM protein [Patescibacteria group bacterium]|nr:radical SAM protein [Patescibacteria group bacterium]
MIKYNNYPFYNFHAIKAAYIHASDVCNFQCEICKLPQVRKKSFVPLDVLKIKITKAVSLGLDNIIFTGQEVILHPDIAEIIKFSFNNAKVNYITFNTNGLAFANDSVWEKLESVKKHLHKVYIAVSVNFYNQKTFSNWSGHGSDIFEKWRRGFSRAVNSYLNISGIDIILKKDSNIIKILDFLFQFSNNKKDYQEGVRIINLMPFGHAIGSPYKSLKYKLTGASKKIIQVVNKYPGKIHFEGFPICAFNQNDLKKKKYFIYNFHICHFNGVLAQYDPNIYETYYSGPTENWLINKKELIGAYDKMFYYVDECQNCYYRNKCNGIQREYLKFYSAKNVNDEIKSLKLLNWK